jgi:hypothetical protein
MTAIISVVDMLNLLEIVENTLIGLIAGLWFK